MTQDLDPGMQEVVAADERRRPELSSGPPPELLDALPSDGGEEAAQKKYWGVCKYDGVNVRDVPRQDASSRGKLVRGDSVWTKSDLVTGERYQACGGAGVQWLPVWYHGSWGFVPFQCMNWYSQ